MRVELQGYNECMLGTIAALADVSIERVRNSACERAKIDKWSDISNRNYWPVVTYLMMLYDIEGIPQSRSEWVGAQPMKTTTLSLKGRGSIILRETYTRDTHIMAFEDNIVYDSGKGISYPVADLSLQYLGWIVKKVTYERGA